MDCNGKSEAKSNSIHEGMSQTIKICSSIYLLPTVESRWVSSVNAMSCRIMLMQCIHPLLET